QPVLDRTAGDPQRQRPDGGAEAHNKPRRRLERAGEILVFHRSSAIQLSPPERFDAEGASGERLARGHLDARDGWENVKFDHAESFSGCGRPSAIEILVEAFRL